MMGTIRNLVEERAFGFIVSGNDSETVFFHKTACEDDFYGLHAGDIVEFEEDVRSPKGRRALTVRRA